jgi:transposase
MWTPTTREQHSRKNQRYQSDLTDEEWCVIEPHLAKPRATGRPRTWAMREIINGIFYVMRAGCTWPLFAAFDIATGKVSGRHYSRRRRVEFLDFMNRLLAQHPGREIHVILDNLSTHKPKRDQRLKRHRNVHFHFTPTHASWLNQVEIWFSVLTGKSLAGASFNSAAELKAHIHAFIATYNDTAKPFAWTKSKVHQKRLKAHFADQ